MDISTLDSKLLLNTDFTQENSIDSAEKNPSYLIVTNSHKHLKVSPTSYFLLQNFNKGYSPQAVTDLINKNQSQKISVEKVVESYKNLIDKITEIDRRESPSRSGFWFLWEILPNHLVNIIARPFSLLFSPSVLAFVIILLGLSVFFGIQKGIFFDSILSINNPKDFWIGYLLFIFSVIIHEFGHAGASVKYNAMPSGIGFTIYLIFPAFYSDVTSSWKLKSKQRAVIGLGGIYLQLIVASLYILIFGIFSINGFGVAVLMIFGSCILNLNPFFRFDGYWILSDLLGVLNLNQQPKEILAFIYKKLRKKETKPLPWSNWVSYFVGIYSVGYILMITFFITIYLPYFLSELRSYPVKFQQFFINFFNNQNVNFGEYHKFLISSIMVFIFTYFVYNVALKPLSRKLLLIIK